MTEQREVILASRSALPDFDVQLTAPSLAPWTDGNVGIPGFTTFQSGAPGPHVALIALTHGNEIAGAIVLDRLLRGQIRPTRGTLTLGFANLLAFARFDPAQPTASRYVDEDLNRVWDPAVLDGPRRSQELERARQIRPLIDTVDILLDLHSMLWPSKPLVLCGVTAKGREMARGLAAPELIVADGGHASGRRLMDYGAFADPATASVANLVEAGQHWERGTVAVTEAAAASVLVHVGIQVGIQVGIAPTSPAPHQIAEVTHTVTAATPQFGFVQAYQGGAVIERRNTLIAMDGTAEIRTPYDNCLLVMPSLRPTRGHTAVRMARFIERDDVG
jgi:predicted deacylase